MIPIYIYIYRLLTYVISLNILNLVYQFILHYIMYNITYYIIITVIAIYRIKL